jgi:hypothetical protein
MINRRCQLPVRTTVNFVLAYPSSAVLFHCTFLANFNPLTTSTPHCSRGLRCTNAQSNLVQFFRRCNAKVKLNTMSTHISTIANASDSDEDDGSLDPTKHNDAGSAIQRGNNTNQDQRSLQMNKGGASTSLFPFHHPRSCFPLLPTLDISSSVKNPMLSRALPHKPPSFPLPSARKTVLA